jgi:hypothetical protein
MSCFTDRLAGFTFGGKVDPSKMITELVQRLERECKFCSGEAQRCELIAKSFDLESMAMIAQYCREGGAHGEGRIRRLKEVSKSTDSE